MEMILKCDDFDWKLTFVLLNSTHPSAFQIDTQYRK